MKDINNIKTFFKTKENNKGDNMKKGQVTVFLVIAIAIVAAILIFFFLRGSLTLGGPPKEVESVYNFYLNCIESESEVGAIILGQQGGYINGPEFSSGSAFMPFSNYIDFLGVGIPYWFYISGNGVEKEQVPTREIMQEELNQYLEQRILECDFSSLAQQGFNIDLGKNIEVITEINDNSINIKVDHDIILGTENISWTGKTHITTAKSNLGNFHDLAIKIYENNNENLFLENYAIDIIRLYAPVDGVEIQCNPVVWNVEEVRENITLALEANIPFTKIKGDYYDLSDDDNNYFVQDIGEEISGVNVNFLYSRNWPSKMEVFPNDEGLLISDPIGTQEGLGILGFCYVPYHFVYDLAYPVMIQLYDDNEIFQYPVVVYVNKNRPRVPLEGAAIPNAAPELCVNKNTQISVSTYNINLEPVEADIQFKCFDTTCRIGSSSIQGNIATLTSDFPQCGNGFIIVNADGYATKKQIFSTIVEGSTDIFLDREYELNVQLDSQSFIENAIITFTKDKKVTTLSYPEIQNVKLTVGQYEIKVIVYSDANIKLDGSSEQKCINIPKSGVLGIIGFEEEKCFDLEIPSQTINSGVSGGGTQNYFISESEVEIADTIILGIENFPTPTTIEDLQINFNKVETADIDVRFIWKKY